MKRSRSGLTLIEILVTMALMSLVMGLIVNFFVGQSRAARLQKAINETSEATRVALSLVTWDLQNAGYRVNVSNTNPAIKTSYPLPSGATAINNSSGLYDQITIRFRDDSIATPANKRVSYGLSGGSLKRQIYNDDATIPDMQPSVNGIVALNIRYETRDNQFISPTGTGTTKACPAGSTVVPTGATGAAITNCSVLWTFSNTPGRLVRQVRVQVLARSSEKISGHTSSVSSYSFDGATAYTTSAGYVYQFSEQTIVTPNLGR
jgi:prepilin-type N-terminal cleavage/methylation domain-containing protein